MPRQAVPQIVRVQCPVPQGINPGDPLHIRAGGRWHSLSIPPSAAPGKSLVVSLKLAKWVGAHEVECMSQTAEHSRSLQPPASAASNFETEARCDGVDGRSWMCVSSSGQKVWFLPADAPTPPQSPKPEGEEGATESKPAIGYDIPSAAAPFDPTAAPPAQASEPTGDPTQVAATSLVTMPSVPARTPQHNKELPEGWAAVSHVSRSGKSYVRYLGPRGMKAQSIKQAWSLHSPAPPEAWTMGVADEQLAMMVQRPSGETGMDVEQPDPMLTAPVMATATATATATPAVGADEAMAAQAEGGQPTAEGAVFIDDAPFVGKRVAIHSLWSRPDLNGKEGDALVFDATKGRYTVEVLGELVALRPSSLVEVGAAGSSVPPSLTIPPAEGGITGVTSPDAVPGMAPALPPVPSLVTLPTDDGPTDGPTDDVPTDDVPTDGPPAKKAKTDGDDLADLPDAEANVDEV